MLTRKMTDDRCLPDQTAQLSVSVSDQEHNILSARRALLPEIEIFPIRQLPSEPDTETEV